jgi:hypothetical protein
MRALPLLLALLLAAPAGAATIVLDFEEEPLAVYQGTTFASAECGGCVTFAEQDGGWLFVEDALGSRVLIPGEEGGRLSMTFSVPVTGVSLDFGHDTPDAESIGDAVLDGLIGGVVVVSSTVAPNQNGSIDQTISISYVSPLEAVRFRLPQSGEFEPISPYIDNVVLTVQEVPEPAALGLLAPLLLLSTRRRRGASPSSRPRARAIR